MELKPCPFCGSHQVDLFGDDELGWLARCADCHASAGDCDTKTETIEAWNTRAERTCKRIDSPNDDEGRPNLPTCSECGEELSYTDRFCPNCGAKVVETRESKGCEYCQTEGFDGQVVMMSNHGWQRINYCPNCGRKVVK